tara:strand:- start:157 stop:1332 length:1176 start_codon:yes stop_codon:yes gene_type:complete
MRQTAGLSPQELIAMQQAQAGIGSYKPYLQAQEQGLLEGIGMSRRAGEMLNPYFGKQEDLLGIQGNYLGTQGRLTGEGLGTARRQQGLINQGIGQSQFAAGMQFDPSRTQQFYDPYEDQVVQQTLDDAFKQGEMQDISARAQNISSGGESAFGSRARLSAEERRAALGRGVGEALAGIRSRGFGQAQGAAQQEFGRLAGAQQQLGGQLAGYGGQLAGAGQNISGFGSQFGGLGSQYGQLGSQYGQLGGNRAAATRQVGSDVAGYGSQLGQLGATDYNLGAQQRSELANLGATARGVKETGLGRQYEQQVQNRFAPTQAASYVQGFLPQYQGGGTEINKSYGIPADPLSMGLGTFFNTYANFAGNNQQGQNPYPQQDPNTSNNPASIGGGYS